MYKSSGEPRSTKKANIEIKLSARLRLGSRLAPLIAVNCSFVGTRLLAISGGYAELPDAYVMTSQPISPNIISHHKAPYFKFDGNNSLQDLQAYNVPLSFFRIIFEITNSLFFL